MRKSGRRGGSNWKPVSNSEPQVPSFQSSITLRYIPIPGENLADHIHRLHTDELRMHSDGMAARVGQYQYNPRRVRRPPPSAGTGPWAHRGLKQRGVSRATNNEKEPANA
jgi:hypothetical protein